MYQATVSKIQTVPHNNKNNDNIFISPNSTHIVVYRGGTHKLDKNSQLFVKIVDNRLRAKKTHAEQFIFGLIACNKNGKTINTPEHEPKRYTSNTNNTRNE